MAALPVLSFRAKLLLAMMLVVATVTTLAVTQRTVEATYARISRERFESEADGFAALQEARLASARTAVANLAKSVRLVAALNERDPTLLYKTAVNELRNVLEPDPTDLGVNPASFFRVTDRTGAVLAPPEGTPAGLLRSEGPADWERSVASAARAALADRTQHVGYLAPATNEGPSLHEVIITPIVDEARQELVGALAIGFAVSAAPTANASSVRIPSGIWLDDHLYARDLPPALVAGAAPDALRAALRTRIGASPTAAKEAPAGDFDLTLGGHPYRVFYRPLHEESRLPAAHLVALHSLAETRAEQRDLRRSVLRFAGLALLLGLVSSLLLSRTLSARIRELVAGAGAIGRGDLAARVAVKRRDEVGQLAAAFNDMADGLALKERYRSALDVIADKAVAQQLVEGTITLGGGLKVASILFCDIRGFTALTEHMPPEDVIALLNEHMTALTRIVHDHHGVVDKFVGDALMAVFGAPRASADHGFDAVRTARLMIAARRRLNERAAHPLEIGIGIASGTIVAGCMGSEDRMNYTVLGERVNLAARLCSQAGGMEVLIDDETRRLVVDRIDIEAMPTIQLRGFRAQVPVYRVADRDSLATAS